ncbi:MAG: hypothetical protein COU65_01530 [Candidatus Pacebacteria bacterium CG10_big_fil_rev_8_21_14_0_10_42_12]|nr:type II toxin-antitoxin system Phd/YefM family antitoxin [Candidatus Paceibacterota bacterium]PIR62794.1 MAG: hypothetical protein COU65_01530 [Candidatus Pacebacteria bacterium CG10_big_fil_rev_8_21_14_0_10_42_12]
MKILSTSLSASTARDNFYDLLTNASKGTKRYQITRRGHEPVVMMSADEFEMYQETLAIQEDTELMKDIAAGIKDIKAKNFTSHEDMKKQFGL